MHYALTLLVRIQVSQHQSGMQSPFPHINGVAQRKADPRGRER